MESNINGGEDTQPKDNRPQITESIIEQRSNEDIGKCDHFSIRAYVAEVRKRDWKICWPFTSSSVECKETNDHEEFRCWYCRNCLCSSDATDIYVVPNIYKDKDCEENVDTALYEYLPLIDLVRKEKVSRAMSNTKTRHHIFANGKKESDETKTVNEGKSVTTCTRRKEIQFLNEENVSGDAETTNLDVGGDPNYGVLDLEFGDRKLKTKRTYSDETCYKDDHVHRVPEIAKTLEKGIESESMESGSVDSQASFNRNICSLKSNQNDQNKDIEIALDEQQSSKCYRPMEILKCKRPQKVRLLSDILRRDISGGSCDLSSLNGTVNSDNMDTRVTDTEDADDSDDLTLDTLFKIQKVVQPNTGKITGCRKKRKRFQVEDFGPGQSRWSNGGSEVWSCKNSNKENDSVQSVIGSSESVKTALFKDGALVSRAEKRQRKPSFEYRRSSKMSQENLCQESLLVSTDPESKETQTGPRNRQFHLPNDTPTEFDIFQLNVGGSQDGDRESISRVNENRDKGSIMLPHEFVPMKERVGDKDVNVGPYFPASNRGSDSPSHFKNKHGTLKRKKGSSFPCNNENNIVPRANSEATEIPSSEMDALDDIPMEIVKLLADNRRERRLLEAEKADHNTICHLRSVNEVEYPHKVQPPRAYDDIKSRDLTKNSFQAQRKHFRVGGDTLYETTSSCMEVSPKGRVPHVVTNPTKINSTQMSSTYSPKQFKPIDMESFSKKTAEKPCACVQKKIGLSPNLDASLTRHGNDEPVQVMQLLRLMEVRPSSRTSHNDGLQKIDDTHKMPLSVEQGKHHTFGKPRAQVSGDIVSDSVKSCKKTKLKSSFAALEAMNGRVNGEFSGKYTLGRGYQSLSSASDYTVLPVEPNMVKKKKSVVAWPVKGGEICSVNRNPADFSIPGTGNKFMRRGRSENSRKGKPKPTCGKISGSLKGIIPACVA